MAPAIALAFLPVVALWFSTQASPALLLPLGDLLVVPLTFLAYVAWRRLGWMHAALPLTFVAVAFALFSLFTGFFNTLTDEAYTTPLYFHLLPNLYGHPFPAFAYVNLYGSSRLEPSEYVVYLPGLVLAYAVPLPAATVSLAAWGVTCALVRRSATALFFLGGPFCALMAANGYNDAVALLLLTLGFVPFSGPTSRWVQFVAMGFKQFANVLAFAYWSFRRDLAMMLGTVAATALWLLPFFLMDPHGTLCHAVLGDQLLGPGCFPRSNLLDYHDYNLYPLWALGIFGPKLVRHLRGGEYRKWREKATGVVWHVRRDKPKFPEEEVLLVVAALLRGWAGLARSFLRLYRLALLGTVAVGVDLALDTLARPPFFLLAASGTAVAATVLVALAAGLRRDLPGWPAGPGRTAGSILLISVLGGATLDLGALRTALPYAGPVLGDLLGLGVGVAGTFLLHGTLPVALRSPGRRPREGARPCRTQGRACGPEGI